jgi:hypothetical protein
VKRSLQPRRDEPEKLLISPGTGGVVIEGDTLLKRNGAPGPKPAHRIFVNTFIFSLALVVATAII